MKHTQKPIVGALPMSLPDYTRLVLALEWIEHAPPLFDRADLYTTLCEWIADSVGEEHGVFCDVTPEDGKVFVYLDHGLKWEVVIAK